MHFKKPPERNRQRPLTDLCLLVTLVGVTLPTARCIETPSIFCPDFCRCDLYNGLNRADCSARRLIYANVEIPPAVEILDVSYNDITQLDNNCFMTYHYLLNISAAHNAIHTIYLNAFSQLGRVESIDLSYNRLEYLDERLFELNRRLHTLNLEGNKFSTLKNRPILRSTTLRVLNLRNSQIDYIHTKMFNALPQLQELDVSQNLMISMSPMAFNALRTLRRVNLNENPWNCDGALMKSVEILGRRNIDVSLIDCSANKKWFKGEKLRDDGMDEAELIPGFDKMEILQPSSRHEEDENTKYERQTIANWRMPPKQGDPQNDDAEDEPNHYDNDGLKWDDPISDDPDINETKLFLGYPPIAELCNGVETKMCQRYQEYLLNVSQLLLKRINADAKRPPQTHAEPAYSTNDLYFVFALGITIGMSVVVFIWSCALCCNRCVGRRAGVRQAKCSSLAGSDSLVGTTALPAVAPPLIRPRRGRSSRRAQLPQAQRRTTYALAHYDAADASRDNFLTRLFGRPARHQYYRTINQNTATLIRRLSRSNLFNNRLSQHFERERSREPSSPAPTDAHDTPDHSTTAAPSAPAAPATAPLLLARPETPPPSYVEVLVNASCDRK